MITESEFSDLYIEKFVATQRYLMSFGCWSTELAEEYAQAGWARAWEKRAQWTGKASFTTWVYTIATNLWMMHVRKWAPKPTCELKPEYLVYDPTAEYEAHIQLDKVRRCRPKAMAKFTVLVEQSKLNPTIKSRYRRARLEVKAFLVQGASA